MTRKDNILKAIRFENPEYIPMTFHINNACWHHYDNNLLQDLMEEHRFLFPDFERKTELKPTYKLNQIKNRPYTDPWGCVWKTKDDGITGSVVDHPLGNWDKFKDYKSPDYNKTDGMHPIHWEEILNQVHEKKMNGEPIIGGLPHGHTFLRILDIRGYENLIFDMACEEPNLQKLIKMVEEFNLKIISKWLELNPDIVEYPEDLGMQMGPMLSPEMFVKYIKPVYNKLMKPAKDKNCIIHMHSDGDIRTLVDDLIGGGIDALNLQDLVNGIDWIAEKLSGRICVDLDIDRQKITAHGSPKQIDKLIKEEVSKIGTKKGGLMMIYGLYPGVPVENIKALMDSMEKYADFYS